MLLKPALTRSLALAACLLTLAALSPAHAERAPVSTGDAALGSGLGAAGGAALGSGLGDGLGGGLGGGTGYDRYEWDARDARDERRYEDAGQRDRSHGLRLREGDFCPPGHAQKGNC